MLFCNNFHYNFVILFNQTVLFFLYRKIKNIFYLNIPKQDFLDIFVPKREYFFCFWAFCSEMGTLSLFLDFCSELRTGVNNKRLKASFEPRIIISYPSINPNIGMVTIDNRVETKVICEANIESPPY